MINTHAAIFNIQTRQREPGTQLVQSTDQAAHQGLQIPVGAITTALLATRKDT